MRILVGLNLFVALLLSFNIGSEPVIRQAFPTKHALLGEPLTWTIEVHHPLWEQYNVQTNPCRGLEIRLKSSKTTGEKDQARTIFRFKIIPTQIGVSEAPSLLISNQRGQNTVLSGKVINVGSISGNSLEIKQPMVPQFPQPLINRKYLAWVLVTFAFLLTGTLIWFGRYWKQPRQMTLRQLRKAIVDIRSQSFDPIEINQLLRSPILWGNGADTKTAAELKESAGGDASLNMICDTLLALDQWRYSGGEMALETRTIHQSVVAAMNFLQQHKAPGIAGEPQ